MAMANQDAVRLVKPYVDAKDAEGAAALKKLFLGQFATAPEKADFIGQLYVNTTAATAGLYVATGTTTPGWKAVEHAS